MEIQGKIAPAAGIPAPQQYNQDTQPFKRTNAATPGVVLDIQSRQEPLGVALSGALNALVENAGLSERFTETNPSSAIGPDSVATQLSSVAAHLIADEVAANENTDSLPKLFESIKQSIDQGFEDAARLASDPDNIPLQQARSVTRQHLNALEDMLGIRDNKA